MSEKNNLENTHKSSSTTHRPAGFGTRKPAETKKPQRKPLPAKSQPEKRVISKSKPAVKSKPQVKETTAAKPRKYLRPKDLLFAVIFVVVIAAFIVGVVLLIGNGRTVHQMPTILRITEEPTQKPEEIAMLPDTIHLTDSGAVPSLDGICA